MALVLSRGFGGGETLIEKGEIQLEKGKTPIETGEVESRGRARERAVRGHDSCLRLRCVRSRVGEGELGEGRGDTDTDRDGERSGFGGLVEAVRRCRMRRKESGLWIDEVREGIDALRRAAGLALRG
jgi:hypothetical protein